MPTFYYSEQFERFSLERMSGPEFGYFEQRVGLIARHPPGIGEFHEDWQAQGSVRRVRFYYYYAAGLKQLFVIGAHLLRQGEPVDLDQEQMKDYLDRIQAWEALPQLRPACFPEED